jgi:hypothetical protein
VSRTREHAVTFPKIGIKIVEKNDFRRFMYRFYEESGVSLAEMVECERSEWKQGRDMEKHFKREWHQTAPLSTGIVEYNHFGESNDVYHWLPAPQIAVSSQIVS